MKKTLLLLIAGLTLAATVQAAPVDAVKAHRVAVEFWNTHHPSTVKPVESMQQISFSELQHQYVFAFDTVGFVIVAADDQVRPVLGYSFDSPFPTRLHPELRFWLSIYESQIALLPSDGAADPRWSTLTDGIVPPAPVSLQNVAAICHTRWDQGDPYNRLCPYDSVYSSRSVVGCVATAMAQIMKRWNHPSCGTGSHSYIHHNSDLDWSYGMLSADFEHTTYLWEIMPNVVYTTTNERALALSTLSYHCGVAVDMMYGPSATGGSGAYSSCGSWSSTCAESAFRDNFKYSADLEFRQRNTNQWRDSVNAVTGQTDWYIVDSNLISDSVWMAMIDEELANGRPMYYSGSDASGGHAFVLDGSDLDTCYHFNWGWSGYGDGFFAINDLAPGTRGMGSNNTNTFNHEQGAIFGIQPIPEHFDTIDLYDTICTNYTRYNCRDYSFPVVTCDTVLRHLDTVIRLHLQVRNSHILTLSQGFGGIISGSITQEFCSYQPLVLPECTFTRNGYYFAGWSLSRNGNTDPVYQPGDTIHLHGNTTLFARWRDTNDVAVDEVDDERIALWPNPTTGELTIDLASEHEAQIMVLDVLGRSVLSVSNPQTAGQVVKISLSGLPNGAYTVQIRTESGLYNRRIIKQ